MGDSNVGKTSLMVRFTENYFDAHQTTTIGMDFQEKRLQLTTGEDVKLTIWDTAGQERFRALAANYYRGAQGVILVYDVNERRTFENLATWLKEVEQNVGRAQPAVIMVVGSKLDLGKREVDTEEGQTFARDNRTLFIETSSANDIGVRDAFEELVQKIIEGESGGTSSTGSVSLGTGAATDSPALLGWLLLMTATPYLPCSMLDRREQFITPAISNERDVPWNSVKRDLSLDFLVVPQIPNGRRSHQ